MSSVSSSVGDFLPYSLSLSHCLLFSLSLCLLLSLSILFPALQNTIKLFHNLLYVTLIYAHPHFDYIFLSQIRLFLILCISLSLFVLSRSTLCSLYFSILQYCFTFSHSFFPSLCLSLPVFFLSFSLLPLRALSVLPLWLSKLSLPCIAVTIC